MRRADETTQELETTQSRPKTLGLERWVQMAFLAVRACSLFWVLDKIITLVWDRFAEPHARAGDVVAAFVASAAITFVLYRKPKVQPHRARGRRRARQGQLAVAQGDAGLDHRRDRHVADRRRDRRSFDAAWSAITDLIYKV